MGHRTGPTDDVERRLLGLVASVKTWKQGEARAPHKPLLLLLALGRIQRGEAREIGFPAIEKPLRSLIERFGPPRRSYHADYPFWYLRNDQLWHVRDAESFSYRRGHSIPPVSALRDAPAFGGLPAEFDSLLRARPGLIGRIATEILDEHFPDSLHADILAAVGLDAEARESGSRRVRDPGFPGLVLRAYEHRCAVCGLDVQLDGRSVGLEAAHVQWHSHGGPSDVANGLCLCPVHHKAFDLGAIGLTPAMRIQVSQRVHGGDATRDWILRFHGEGLRGPQSGAPAPDARFVHWHEHQVFKTPARAG